MTRLLTLCLLASLPTAAQGRGLEPPTAATFSIVAIDPANGDLGVAVASRYFSVGSVVPWAMAGVGAVATQANVNVVSARINTLGERAEDVFLIDGARLHDEQALLRLETALYEELKIR